MEKQGSHVTKYISIIAAGFLLLFAVTVSAQSKDELQQTIQEKSELKQELLNQKEEILDELSDISEEKQTHQTELSIIEKEKQSLETNISLTENQIDTLDLEITQTNLTIDDYNLRIARSIESVQQTLRSIKHRDDATLFEVVLSGQHISDFFKNRDELASLQNNLIDRTQQLLDEKKSLFFNKEKLSSQQQSLSTETKKLEDQKSIITEEQKQKQAVLGETTSRELSYQEELRKTEATIAKLDSEIRDFESKLAFILNPSSIPEKGSSVLSWPLDSVLITQRFGKTVSSERLYTSGSHSGMDFRAATGTPVYAVADGIVKGTGDTDRTCYRASFGKWIFIEHDNIGLSSTSGHMSKISVTEGQRVQAGDLIGYAGNTGRSTASHLHLTIYATKGVDGEEGARVTDRPSAACAGKTYRMPLAPTRAYLDPIDYLPSTNASMFKHPSLAV